MSTGNHQSDIGKYGTASPASHMHDRIRPHPDAVKAAEDCMTVLLEELDVDKAARRITAATRMRERDECIAELAKALRACCEHLEDVRTGEDFEVKCWDAAEAGRSVIGKAKGFIQ